MKVRKQQLSHRLPYFVVQAPALNAYFVGYRQDNKLMLALIIDDSTMNLRAGSSVARRASLW